MSRARCAWLLAVLAACPAPDDDDDFAVGDDDDDDATVETRPLGPGSEGDFAWGDDVVCEDPFAGWAGRFVEDGADRGLTEVLAGELIEDGGIYEGYASVVPADLDGDGDLDLVFGHDGGAVHAYLNDGAGDFDPAPTFESPPTWPHGDQPPLLAVADLDGDALPEVLAVGEQAWVWDDLGDGSWGAPAVIAVSFDEPPAALTVGDTDGDGDLDAVLGTFAAGPDGPYFPELLLLNDGAGGFTVAGEVVATAGHVSTQAITLTDRDLDGDPDLFVADGMFDAAAPSAFFTNDGSGGFTDEAAALSADLVLAGMGFATWDWNGDGAFDYFVTDVGPARCLVSDGGGRFFEATAQIGLGPAERPFEELEVATIGWSLDVVDLDHDGVLDAVQASAPDFGTGLAPDQLRWPDLVWRGTSDGAFVDVTGGSGFGTSDANYGSAPGDFDGDGSQDIVVAGPGRRPRLYLNRCSAGGWLEVELLGPPGNADAIGAVLWVDGASPRELQGPRGWGQRPSRFHVGLGDATEASLELRWPDGAVSTIDRLRPRRRVVVTHPAAR